MRRTPPQSTLTDTLCPCTPLCRSHDDIAVGRADGILHRHIGVAVAARSGIQVDGYAGRGTGIGDGIVAGTTDDAGVGGIDHDGVVADAAIMRGFGSGAPPDERPLIGTRCEEKRVCSYVEISQ